MAAAQAAAEYFDEEFQGVAVARPVDAGGAALSANCICHGIGNLCQDPEAVESSASTGRARSAESRAAASLPRSGAMIRCNSSLLGL